jgi:hypothetical protein
MKKSSKQTKRTNAGTTDLAPIVGRIGPAATAVGFEQAIFGKEHPTGTPARSVDAIAAERIVLRDEDGPGHGLAGASLGRLLSLGVTGCDDPPEEVLSSTLFRLDHDLGVVALAAAALEGGEPIASLAKAMKTRIEVAQEIHARVTAKVPNPDDKHAIVIAPGARTVAASLLMLPGVLSARTAWERLQRIAQRLDVLVLTDGPMVEFWYEKDRERQQSFPSDPDWKPESRYTVWPRVEGGPSLPMIMITPAATDREAELANMLAYAVAKREGYGRLNAEWRAEFAAALLDRAEVKGAA